MTRAEVLLSSATDALTRWEGGQRPSRAELGLVLRWLRELGQELRALAGPPMRDHIPAAVRRRVTARANGRCAVCRNELDPKHTHLDHITPVARYGSSGEENLRAICGPCNLSKGAREAS